MQTLGPGASRPARSVVAAALLGVSLFGLSPAAAETLQGALAKAYQTNPTLNAARANQMATDENVPIQRAAGLPAATVNSTFNENVLIPGGQFIIIPRSMQTQGQLTVPIYQGGLVKNGIKAADARVAAGEETLRATEASVFSQVVAAYNDVLRDTQIVELNRNNVKNLEVNLRATQDRFEVGDLTRTDVAQSEARLSQARADLRNAEANLIGSKERYIQQVGEVPADLSQPPPLPGLPADVGEAVEIAIKENPDIAAATKNSEAAGFDVKAARAGRLPTLSGFGTVSRNDNFGGAIVPPGFPAQPSSQTSAVIGARMALPIYQGGRPSAQIRQSQARKTAAQAAAVAHARPVSVGVAPKAAGVIWKAECIDKAALVQFIGEQIAKGDKSLLNLLEIDPKAINTLAKLQEANLRVPGLRPFTEARATRVTKVAVTA